MSSGVVPTIDHAFSCGASLSAMHSGVVPHYRPCLLVWCLIISHVFWSGAHYRLCLLVWCLIINHACWCIVSLKAMPSRVVSHYQHCLLVWFLTIDHACLRGTHYRLCLLVNRHCNLHFTSPVQMEEGWSLVLPIQRCQCIRHVC